MKSFVTNSVLVVFAVIAAVACGGGSDDESSAPPCGELKENGTLRSDESVMSCDGRHKFINQNDGNVVLYHPGDDAVWASNTVGPKGTLTLQSGDLRLTDSSGNLLFHTDTGGHPGATFKMQDDGNGVIYDTAGTAIWATNTVAGSGGGGGGGGGGCTSDSDCHDRCKRCVRSSGSCVSRLSC
jgi:hypothetical protein